MAKSAYLATVQILIPECDSQAQAEDAIIAMLTENLQYSGAILDWGYLKIGGQFLYPQKIAISDDYEEGEAFR